MAYAGAVLYLIWGGLHLRAAYQVASLGRQEEAGAIRGRLLQSAWNLAFLAIVVTVVAVTLNWQNSPLGFWMNLAIASATDIGFILFILLPGYLPLWPGAMGPSLWVLATVFSAFAVLGISA